MAPLDDDETTEAPEGQSDNALVVVFLLVFVIIVFILAHATQRVPNDTPPCSQTQYGCVR